MYVHVYFIGATSWLIKDVTSTYSPPWGFLSGTSYQVHGTVHGKGNVNQKTITVICGLTVDKTVSIVHNYRLSVTN